MKIDMFTLMLKLKLIQKQPQGPAVTDTNMHAQTLEHTDVRTHGHEDMRTVNHTDKSTDRDTAHKHRYIQAKAGNRYI